MRTVPLALAALVLLAACQRPPVASPATSPAQSDPDLKAVLGFFDCYSRRDLEGMMSYLDEGALFQAPGQTMNKQQIRNYFQATLQKYPKLRVEAAPPRRIQNTIQVSVKVETNVISVNTWVIDMKNGRIRAYSFAPGAP